jgi:hypothetical protein
MDKEAEVDDVNWSADITLCFFFTGSSIDMPESFLVEDPSSLEEEEIESLYWS